MKNFARSVLALALLALAVVSPVQHAAAQSFPSTATFAPASAVGGTANAITIAIDNWFSNQAGVPIRFMPLFDNSGPVQVNVNGVGLVNLLKPANPGLTALSSGEIRAGQIAQIMWDGTQFILQSQLGQFVSSSTLAGSALSFAPATNLQITGTVAANQLTIALKTGSSGASPADATAATPIIIPFRDVTIANGYPVPVRVTGALSLTIASGNTMGCVSASMCRLWVVAINNGGTAALCAYNALSGKSVVGLNEATLQTSAAGTTGGSLAQTLYCSTASVSSKSIRYLGYIDIQETTAGAWSSPPTYVQLFGPGIAKPGERINLVRTDVTGFVTFGSPTLIPTSNSVPTSTSGDLYMTAATYTPTSAANLLKVSARSIFTTGGGTATFTWFIIRDNAGNALTSSAQGVPSGNQQQTIGLDTYVKAQAVTGTVFTVRGGPVASTATYFNGNTGAAILGGTSNSFIDVEEIQG